MKIVIAGAGDIGFHLAKMMAHENKDIVLIDTNQDVLDYAQGHLDVITLYGDSSSPRILKEAQVNRCQLFLAVTTSEKNNLTSAILAKKMGAQHTVARVNNPEYTEPEQKAVFEELGVDSLISPRQLAAQEICRLMTRVSLTDIFEFEGGKMMLIGITLDGSTRVIGHTVESLRQEQPDLRYNLIALLRNHQTVIPYGQTILKANDHLYILCKRDDIDAVIALIGKQERKIQNVMIIGGSDVAYRTAQLLESQYRVSLIEGNKASCLRLAENLNSTLIIRGDAKDVELMRSEGLESTDAFLSLNDNTETNIIASLIAKNHGVYKTIALVDSIEYTRISQSIGIDTLINKKLIAANNIFRHIRKGNIEAITGLNGVDAEVIEFVIHKNNRLTRKPIKNLRLPEKAFVGGVIRGEDSYIPDGDFMFEMDDKVIVFAQPEAIHQVEQLFR